MRVAAPLLDMFAGPDGSGALTTQLLHGEAVDLYAADPGSGMAWVQNAADGYVGYVAGAGLAPDEAGPDDDPAPEFLVTGRGTQLYAAPGLKQVPCGALPWLARVRVAEERDGYARLGCGRWCPRPLLGRAAPGDFVAVAERLVGVPYLWGGRSQAGLDCSALVQLALAATGVAAPRDSDQQQALGAPADGACRRGDLLFWRGHVAIVAAPDTLLHANAHHMAVAIEPLRPALARIAATDTGPVTAARRLA
ncbi:peptidase P60 [Rhodobacteraceae bacterium 2CG4]|uniref:Peptidase P60 n=2 Tax=Halovulum marinum TaxID=2662447 RepID=A0A6L5Z052_9RHOB|nr:peptidase P60 [Halovulum marinum]